MNNRRDNSELIYTMKILVTGANGQLGMTFRNAATDWNHQVLYTDAFVKDEGVEFLDITDAENVSQYLDANTPDVILNFAGYTDVEKAESEENKANEANARAVGILAEEAAARNITLIHISTDYVFDGKTSIPYVEDAEPAPLSAYGRSKLAGELALAESGCRYILIRTSWLYSPYGKNFVKTILAKSAELPVLKVVSDQVGTPTYAGDLVEFIMQIIDEDQLDKTGVYNYSNEGVCSWYDIAVAVCNASGNLCDVLPCRTGEYPTRAQRPHYSLLDKSKVKSVFGVEIPHWADSLSYCLAQMLD